MYAYNRKKLANYKKQKCYRDSFYNEKLKIERYNNLEASGIMPFSLSFSFGSINGYYLSEVGRYYAKWEDGTTYI